MDIQIIKIDETTREAYFEVSHNLVTGINKLIQIVVLSLLNISGKDVLDPDKGGGLPEMVGMNMDVEDTTEIFAEVAQRIKKTQSEVVNDQVGLDLIPEEKLRDIAIVSIDSGEQIDEVLVTIRIVNEVGQFSDLVL